MTSDAIRRKNKRLALVAATIAVAMVGLGFAAVPLYNLFCRVTGYGGTTQRYDPVAAAEEPKVLSDTVSVRFDANVSPKLPWKFYPEHPRDTVTIGARDMTIFIARNESSRPITGTATFNVTPDQAGKYFTTIQRSEEHTSELQSLMRISYAVFCLKKKKPTTHPLIHNT